MTPGQHDPLPGQAAGSSKRVDLAQCAEVLRVLDQQRVAKPWSKRRTLAFVLLTCGAFWALVIAWLL